jgi:hypothetical protein
MIHMSRSRPTVARTPPLMAHTLPTSRRTRGFIRLGARVLAGAAILCVGLAAAASPASKTGPPTRRLDNWSTWVATSSTSGALARAALRW